VCSKDTHRIRHALCGGIPNKGFGVVGQGLALSYIPDGDILALCEGFGVVGQGLTLSCIKLVVSTLP